MRSPSYETSAGALATMLNSKLGVTVLDLFTFTLLDGTVLRWSGFDVPLTIGANTWTLGPTLKRSRVRSAIGIVVDRLDLAVSADDSITIAGTPLLQYIGRGGLRGARVRLDRAYIGEGDNFVTGVLPWFTGRVSEVAGDRTEMRLTIKNELELLDVMIPREIYQPGCANTLYDSACGADRAAFTVTNAASGASDATRTSFPSTLAQATGYFDLGVVTFTSGPNTGQSRTVKRQVGGQVTVLNPFPFAVASGHTFSIVPGCDKSQATCSGKFSRLPFFRGQPYVPVPETVV